MRDGVGCETEGFGVAGPGEVCLALDCVWIAVLRLRLARVVSLGLWLSLRLSLSLSLFVRLWLWLWLWRDAGLGWPVDVARELVGEQDQGERAFGSRCELRVEGVGGEDSLDQRGEFTGDDGVEVERCGRHEPPFGLESVEPEAEDFGDGVGWV